MGEEGGDGESEEEGKVIGWEGEEEEKVGRRRIRKRDG